MYNRYIPQPDGTYRRSRVQEPQPRPVIPPLPRTQEQEENCTADTVCTDAPPPTRPREERQAPSPRPPCRQRPSRKPSPAKPSCERCEGDSVGNFLRNLLPGDFDTGDLLIVLLLLLMAGDCREDQNSALLTLALYLFM